MFAKIFESIYDGTLADHWQALVTFQQMLILADANGIVDMTPAAIHRRTGIPLEVIHAGIEVLERPDPHSRSKDMDGRRIARIDSARDWGWFLVNHAVYRAKIAAEEKRENDRRRIAGRRAAEKAEGGPEPSDTSDMSQAVAGCREPSQEIANVAQAEADVEAEKALLSVGKGAQEDSREAPVDPLNSRAPISEKREEPTPAERLAASLTASGITHVNPTHPRLQKLLAAGVPEKEILDVGREVANAGGGNLAYVCATVEGRRADAAAAAPVAEVKQRPLCAAHVPFKPEPKARSDPNTPMPAVAVALAAKLGIRPPP